jgi:hypothetical protein
MAKTEAHPAHDTDGHGIFIHPLLCTDITLHFFCSSLPNSNQWSKPILLRKQPKIKSDYETMAGSVENRSIDSVRGITFLLLNNRKDLNSVIPSVSNKNLPFFIDADLSRIVKEPFCPTHA